MKGDNFLVKTRSDADIICNFLMDHVWETRPGLDLGWIIRSIDDLYILTDFNDVELYIGFMVYNRDRNVYYFEILPQYRNLGYATDIIKHLDINDIYSNTDTFLFWYKFDYDGNLFYECNNCFRYIIDGTLCNVCNS